MWGNKLLCYWWESSDATFLKDYSIYSSSICDRCTHTNYQYILRYIYIYMHPHCNIICSVNVTLLLFNNIALLLLFNKDH